MAFKVRAMVEEDISQASEIEKEAFPTQWPPTSFRRELNSRLNHYYVIDEEGKETSGGGNPGPKGGLLPRLKSLWGGERPSPPPATPLPYIVGAAGFWYLHDEAHIISIAVREAYRRLGLGELLLITTIDEAIRLGAEVVTLEVRVSNWTAQALYEKYGFRKVGIRANYYTDNNEDGYIMTTDRLTSASYQAHFQNLKERYIQKRGSLPPAKA